MYGYLRIFAVIMICAFMLAIGFVFLEEVKTKYKYTIRTDHEQYRTNSYEKVDNNCIEFKSQCGCGGTGKGSKIRVCGNYSVISNK
jgi:hypothetical protein